MLEPNLGFEQRIDVCGPFVRCVAQVKEPQTEQITCDLEQGVAQSSQRLQSVEVSFPLDQPERLQILGVSRKYR